MKLSSRAFRLLKRKRPAPSRADGTSGAAEPTPARPGPWRWVLPLLCMTVAAIATFALFQYVLLTKLPRTMLGKWVVTEGVMEGATLEFFRDGTMIAKVNVSGKEGTIKARVRVEDKTMWTTSVNPLTGKEETDQQTILRLTDTEFVIQDRKGTAIKMERPTATATEPLSP